LRTPIIIAVAATLVGCSREPPYQAITGSCSDERQFACLNRTTALADQLKTKAPPSYQAKYRATHFVTKKSKPTFITAKAEPSANPISLPPSSSSTQVEPKNEVATAGSETIEPPKAALATNSSSRMIQQQVSAAVAVAKQTTFAAQAAPRALEVVEGKSLNETDALVAIVVARPEIRSISDLEGKVVAMDEEYSGSRGDLLVAFVLAGALPDQFSSRYRMAIDRLMNDEVPAAILALVSKDSAEKFPNIAGFKVFQVPLYPWSPTSNLDVPKRPE